MMKNSAKALFVVVFAVVVCVVFYGVLARERNKANNDLARRIASEGPVENAESIEDIRKAIALYEKKIEQHVADAARAGSYWKILAFRLQDRELHGEALNALEHALYYYPADASLHNAVGISAGVMAKAVRVFPGSDNIERENYYAMAEDAYLRAIEIDSRYLRPRYGLGVLYVFELDRPEEAIPHLERYLEISRNDVDTMFVLARANYMLGNYQAAVELYNRIITLTRDERKRLDAQNNRQITMERIYG